MNARSQRECPPVSVTTQLSVRRGRKAVKLTGDARARVCLPGQRCSAWPLLETYDSIIIREGAPPFSLPGKIHRFQALLADERR